MGVLVISGRRQFLVPARISSRFPGMNMCRPFPKHLFPLHYILIELFVAMHPHSPNDSQLLKNSILTEFHQPLQVQIHLEMPAILVQLGHIQCT